MKKVVYKGKKKKTLGRRQKRNKKYTMSSTPCKHWQE